MPVTNLMKLDFSKFKGTVLMLYVCILWSMSIVFALSVGMHLWEWRNRYASTKLLGGYGPSIVRQGELLPCAHCKSSATLDDCRLIWRVQCDNEECGVCVLGIRAPEPDGDMPDGYWEKYRQSAIDRWNRRQVITGVKFKRMAGFGYSYTNLQHYRFTYVKTFVIKRRWKFLEAKKVIVLPTDEYSENAEMFFCDYRKSRGIAYSKSLYFIYEILDTNERAITEL